MQFVSFCMAINILYYKPKTVFCLALYIVSSIGGAHSWKMSTCQHITLPWHHPWYHQEKWESPPHLRLDPGPEGPAAGCSKPHGHHHHTSRPAMSLLLHLLSPCIKITSVTYFSCQVMHIVIKRCQVIIMYSFHVVFNNPVISNTNNDDNITH